MSCKNDKYFWFSFIWSFRSLFKKESLSMPMHFLNACPIFKLNDGIPNSEPNPSLLHKLCVAAITISKFSGNMQSFRVEIFADKDLMHRRNLPS